MRAEEPKIRYYIVREAERYALVDNPVWRRMVRAARLEQLMLRLLQQTLVFAPYLRTVIRKQIERQFAKPSGSASNVEALGARQKKLKQQREFVVENVDVIGKDEARQRLARLNEELQQLERQQADEQSAAPWDAERVERTTDELIAQLHQSAEVLRALPLSSLRRMLALLTHSLEVDLETGAAEVVFGVPKKALENPERLGYELCIKPTSARKDTAEAQVGGGIALLKFRVFWLGDSYVGYGMAA